MELTLGQFVEHLAPELPLRGPAPQWPPDMFAIAAALLQRSGAYTQVFETWPPANAGPGWRAGITKTGLDWREKAAAHKGAPPQVKKWWREFRKALETPVSTLAEHRPVIEALLQLVAASDEACAGIGIPSAGLGDVFEFQTIDLLLAKPPHTLCRMIDPSRAIVLPKTRTPQNGMTVRSLTHNLALYLPGEVAPNWRWQPTIRKKDNWKLNLLLLPWPLTSDPRQFKKADYQLDSMPPEFGFFDCDPRQNAELEPTVLSAFEAALECLAKVENNPTIDGIIFPELSLRPDEPASIAEATGAFVVGGVREQTSSQSGRCRNYSAVVIPPTQSIHRQAKHHRWRLDESQIKQYKIAALNPEKKWWENIELTRRELTFFAMNDWLTLSVLICEDLARADPTTELLRCVGPNLVIALLMDGPQLRSRWPSRYAIVLADDPGSSVLTLTSLGMALSCFPAGEKTRPTDRRQSRARRRKPSRTIALWKDAESGSLEIELEPKAIGVVLSLRCHFVDEWTADGRSAGKTRGILLLDDDRIYQVMPSRRRRRRKGPTTAATHDATDPRLSSSILDEETFARDEWRLAIVAYWLQRFRKPASTAIDDSTVDAKFKRILRQFETEDAKAVAICWYQGLDLPASPNNFSGIAEKIQGWAVDNAISRNRS